MTLKQAEALLDAKELEWTTEWLAQQPYPLPEQYEAELCCDYIRQKAQEELARNPQVREALRRLRAEKDRLTIELESMERERRIMRQFRSDVEAVWDKCPQYKTFGELMDSPEASELRKRYWQSEAEKGEGN